MSRIVMVHGAGNDLWGPASIKARWFPALADGLAWHGVTVREQDVTVAFYGDVFRPDPEDGYVPLVDKAAAITTIEELVQRLDPHVDLAELTKSLTESHVDRLLAQAAAYLQQPSIRGAARARVEAAIGKITQGRAFTPDQQQWLDRIREHLRANLTIDQDDFETLPVFTRFGGWGKISKVFGPQLPQLIKELNQAIAA